MKSKIIYSNEYIKKEKTQKLEKVSFFKTFFKKKLSDSDFLIFIQSVCEFLKVSNDLGFCIESSIHCVKKEFKNIVKNIIVKINQGESFSSAIKSAGIFPEYAIRIIKVGEKNRDFCETFSMLKDLISWNIEQKKKLKTALSYPIFTFCIFICILFLFSNYIVPSIEGLVTSVNASSVQSFTIFNYFLILVKGIIATSFVFLITMLVSYVYDYRFFEKILYSIPVFGEFFKYKEFYVNSYYIYTSLKNGLDVIESFDVAIDSSVGITKDFLLKLRDETIKGVKMNESLKNFNFIPTIVKNLVKTGEDSGNLQNAFFLIKQIFYSKYQLLMDKFISILPMVFIALTAVMMIGFVMMIFVPLYNFNL